MSELNELKDTLAKMQLEMKTLQEAADKSGALEKELADTKKMLHSYTKTSKTVYVSHDRKLPKFSGRALKDSDPTAEEWLEDATQHLASIQGTEHQMDFLMDHLTGEAKDEVRIRPSSERSTPACILNILREAFKECETVAHLQQLFYKRDQKTDESLQLYSLSLMKIVDRIIKKDSKSIGDRDLMLKERFIDGVSDFQLRREMRKFSFEHPDISFTAFRQAVLKWVEDDTMGSIHKASSRAQEVASERVKVSPMPSKDCGENEDKKSDISPALIKLLEQQQELLQKQQSQLDSLSKLVKDSSQRSKPNSTPTSWRGTGARPKSKSITCYNCNGKGHISRNCPSPRVRNSTATTGSEQQRKPRSSKEDLN